METMKPIKTFPISVKGGIATYEGTEKLVCGNSRYQAEFAFDAEWDDYSEIEKKAKFKVWRNGRYESLVIGFKGNVCRIPPLSNTKVLHVGVFIEGGISTTTAAVIDCLPSILCGASKSMLTLDEIKAINEALRGEKGEDGYTPQKYVDYWTVEDKAEIEGYVDKKLEEDFSDTVRTEEMQTALDDMEAYVDNSANAINKRIDKLEGMIITDIIDSTEAYAKRVPTKSVPKAMLNSVGGKTIKKGSRNICTDAVENGYVATVSAGGSDYIFSMSLPAGTYYIDIKEEVISGSNENELWIWQDYNSNMGWFSNGVNTFENDVDLQIVIENFSGAEDYVCKVFPMIVPGTEAPEGYEPYEAPSLEATKVTEIVSRGRNLVKHIGWYGATSYGTIIPTTEPVNTIEVTQTKYIPREEEDYVGDYRNGYVGYKVEKGSLIGGRRYKVSFDIDIKENPLNYDRMLLNLQTGTGVYFYIPATGKGKVVGVLVSGTNPDRNGFLDIRCMGMSFTISNVMITNENADISTYSPYIAETYALPEVVVNDADWGISVDDVVNTYDFDTKMYSKYAKIKVFDGTEEGWIWQTISSGTNVYYNEPIAPRESEVMCNRFTADSKAGSKIRNNAYISSTGRLNITADGYNSVDEWKAELVRWNSEGTPLTIVYELATPEIKTITDESYPDYKLIKVEGDGELIAENENKNPVPWTVKFAEV